MKLIIAIIRESQLDQVRQALMDADISRITVSRVSGHGQQRREEIYRGQVVIPNLIPKMKLEIALNEEFVDKACDTIIHAARMENPDEGEIGDGKIFVTNLEQCIRIRTGEKGEKAI